MLSQVTENLDETGPFYAHWAKVMGMIAYQPYEVAVMGDNAAEINRNLQKHYLPTAIFMGVPWKTFRCWRINM